MEGKMMIYQTTKKSAQVMKQNNVTSEGEDDSVLANVGTISEGMDRLTVSHSDVCSYCGKKDGSKDERPIFGVGVINLKFCSEGCKMAKYCNDGCQCFHRMLHKDECEKRIAELRQEAETTLFKQPPPEEDCPICFLILPFMGKMYFECCGKEICRGCIQGNIVTKKLCPFCRAPVPKSDEESNERTRKRVEAGDATATFNVGCYYRDGSYGYKQDYTKALELWHRAGELGSSGAYTNIGNAYYFGKGVRVDKKRAQGYFELAAIRGAVKARFTLGCIEGDAGNMDKALKHFVVAARGGHCKSVKFIQELYAEGHVTKDDYSKALHSYQAYLDETRSEQRSAVARGDYD